MTRFFRFQEAYPCVLTRCVRERWVASKHDLQPDVSAQQAAATVFPRLSTGRDLDGELFRHATRAPPTELPRSTPPSWCAQEP